MQTRSLGVAFGVGLLSASTLMVELLLTRLFSVILLYHFAFMAVAVAMPGLGAGGLLAYLHRHRFAPYQLPDWLHGLSLSLAFVIVFVLMVIVSVRVPPHITAGTARVGN